MLDAVNGGVGVMLTVMTDDATHVPPPVAVIVYAPVAAGVTLMISGLGLVDRNKLGPCQIKPTPVVVSLAYNFKVSPWQILVPGKPGELLCAFGAEGVESTTTLIVASGFDVQVSV